MLDVYFESNKEAITFCQRLFQYDHNAEFHCKKNDEGRSKIKIDDSATGDHLSGMIAKALTDVFICHREIRWVKHIVQTCYYYKDLEEIQRIVDLTQSIVTEDQEEFEQIIKDNKPRVTLQKLFAQHANDKVIYFDSIVNFRFHRYREELIEVVGLAIDEFKREEEYQSFVQSLREYVDKKKSKFSTIHVLQGKDFTFYNADGKPFTSLELKMLINKEPLYIVGLDQEELNLTPLLAMAPEEIIIYGDFPSEAKTLTIINVFQERVKFETSDHFPFVHYLKS
ncbi:sporulation protein YtxC [Aquibacillus sediminis]|uniref:sporulation protein YtxC n=1 Tax=Aquibacillus sediminis TaxID=2574734 RepID=UPI0011099341|nr:sporulation protein YtxC [Aquibacillus sediminis]